MARFSDLFRSRFRSDRPSSRRSTHSGHGHAPSSRNDPYRGHDSSRLTRPFNMPDCNYISTPRQDPASSHLGRAASRRETHGSRYNYRDLSPIRPSERPRAFTNRHAFDDHRAVSPLGASRFERLSRTVGPLSASNVGSSISNRTPSYATSSRDTSRSISFEIDCGFDGYERPSTSGGGLFRGGGYQGDTAPRRMGEDGGYSSMLGRERRPNVGSNFRNGGFNWSNF